MTPSSTPNHEEWSRFDPSHDVYQYTATPLKSIFAPKNVAVIGATEKEGSVGRTILWNLISSPFGGAVFPINPKRPSLLGIKAYPSVKDVSDQIDLAVIVTPSASIPGLITECGEVGIKGAIVISAGFKETGPDGVELERQLLENARKYNMRVVGPNCLGVMSPISGQRHFCRRYGTQRQRGFHQPVGRALHRRAGLVAQRRCRFFAFCFRWLNARCQLG